MNRNDLITIGNMLFGERWQTALSLALNVSDRTVRHWVSGRNAAPAGAEKEIIDLVAWRQVNRVRELMKDIGGKPHDITITIYPDGTDMTKINGNWSAACHRKVCERVVVLLNEMGIAASLIESN